MQDKISNITPIESQIKQKKVQTDVKRYYQKKYYRKRVIDSYITNISPNYILEPKLTPLIIEEPFIMVENQEDMVVEEKIKPPFDVESQLEELAIMIEEDIKHSDIKHSKVEREPTMVSCVATSPITSLNIEKSWREIKPEDQILETAKEYLGTEYIWAANGPTAFDCSGYTKYIFNTQGISLPRYSGHQAKIGERISYNELQKGDLVFFDTKNHKKSKRKVNHVGIYLGENQFIHASSAGKKVMITSFEEQPFYKKHFLLGRRVINNSSTFASL